MLKFLKNVLTNCEPKGKTKFVSQMKHEMHLVPSCLTAIRHQLEKNGNFHIRRPRCIIIPLCLIGRVRAHVEVSHDALAKLRNTVKQKSSDPNEQKTLKILKKIWKMFFMIRF